MSSNFVQNEQTLVSKQGGILLSYTNETLITLQKPYSLQNILFFIKGNIFTVHIYIQHKYFDKFYLVVSTVLMDLCKHYNPTA